uniref:glucan endo-1,3-beta-D-glucosidase n=1 Tax=Psilocybe cubensis TaxID=181762 RepID=A0A8H7XN08_PSICU
MHSTITIASIILLSFAPATFGNNNFAGLAVSNSIGGSSSYSCRSQAQWKQVANDAKAQGFKALRILGFDCNALDMASSAAAAAGLQIMAGIFAQSQFAELCVDSFSNDVQTFRNAYNKYGAGRYIGLTIGNEVADSVGNIMAKVYDVRGYLGSVGVHTPVSTVHTWVEIRDNPQLCGADFVGANAHAFYDGGVGSGQAGDFVFKTVRPALQKACPGKKIYITETGWPSRGANNGKAVPSIADERNALLNINCACRDDTSVSVFAFEYDDQLWKSNDNERSFGPEGVTPPPPLSDASMNPSILYKKLLYLTTKHAQPSGLEEILAIRSSDAIHAWGHNYLISRNPLLADRMDNEAFKAHLLSTGPYIGDSTSKVHAVTIDEYQRTAVLHMSYFLRPAKSDEIVEQDLIWTIKFTDDEDVEKILIKETVEFIDAAASSRLGEIIRSIHGEIAENVRGGITLRGF